MFVDVARLNTPVNVVSLFMLATAAVIWWQRWQAVRQKQAIQKAADELGFHLESGSFGLENLPRPLPYLELFTRGTSLRFSHLMQGTHASVPAVLFDFTYSHGAHGGGTLRVAGLQSAVPATPSFSVLPELHLGPLVNTPPVAGKVDFSDQPEFNGRIAVSRIEPAAAHALFDGALRTFFLERWGLAAESQDGWVFVSRVNEPVYGNTRVDAAALRGLLEQAWEVQEAVGTGRQGVL